jgi:hypothetical protein
MRALFGVFFSPEERRLAHVSIHALSAALRFGAA